MALTQVQGGMILASGQSIPKAALPTGSVLQVVNVVNTTQFNSSSSSLTSAYSVSITPTSATSKIFIINTALASVDNATNNGIYLSIYRNGAAILNYPYNLYDSSSGGGQRINPVTMTWLDNPATTSAVTYALYFGSANNTNPVHISQYGNSTMTLMEIAA